MESTLSILQDKQQKFFPLILEELRTKGRKESHWAWWVFPTDLEGSSEPFPKTSILPREKQLFLEGTTASSWREILELIANLVSTQQSWNEILPQIDHGRVEFFITYWRPIAFEHPWLACVLDVLEQYRPTESWNPFDYWDWIDT